MPYSLACVVWPADGGITGDYPPTGGDPGGDSMDGALCDCVGMEGLDDVLCYAWRVRRTVRPTIQRPDGALATSRH